MSLQIEYLKAKKADRWKLLCLSRQQKRRDCRNSEFCKIFLFTWQNNKMSLKNRGGRGCKNSVPTRTDSLTCCTLRMLFVTRPVGWDVFEIKDLFRFPPRMSHRLTEAFCWHPYMSTPNLFIAEETWFKRLLSWRHFSVVQTERLLIGNPVLRKFHRIML